MNTETHSQLVLTLPTLLEYSLKNVYQCNHLSRNKACWVAWTNSQLTNLAHQCQGLYTGIRRFNHLPWQEREGGKKGWRRTITVYPQPYHYWRWACKYYPILLNPLHDAVLTHLPEAPTFTSGFAGAWARVAVSGKVLIYKADSGLVWWARWPEGLRSYWPREMQACGLWLGVTD